MHHISNSADRTSSSKKRAGSRRNKKLKNVPTQWSDITGWPDWLKREYARYSPGSY